MQLLERSNFYTIEKANFPIVLIQKTSKEYFALFWQNYSLKVLLTLKVTNHAFAEMLISSL